MIYRVSEVAREVLVTIDQNNVSEQLLVESDTDTLSLEEIVRSKIEEAARRVESVASVHLLEEGHTFGDAVYWKDRESGFVLLPDDFMRLIAFKMSDWERTVHSAISSGDPEYAKQSSRYKGIRGNAQKPVCAIVNRAEGKALEFYSCKSESAHVSRASYLPYPKVDEHDGIDISERCYRAVVYMAASLTLITIGDADKGTALSELSKSLVE